MSPTAFFKACTTLLIVAAPPLAGAHAQVASTSDTDPALLPDVPPDEAQRDRQVQIGLFTAYAPAFLGSKDYQLVAGPNIQLRYDRAFFSVQNGLGYDVIRSGGWRAGPSIGFRGARRQNGNRMLKIAGDSSDALLGLGTVKATAEAGGYVAYQRGDIAAEVDVKQALGQSAGLIATVGVRYTAMMPLPSGAGGRSAMLSIGPRLSVVDNKYSRTYFGVTALQSTRSGLPEYRAKGGLLSFGVGVSAMIPLTDRISGVALIGYDRLAGDAGRSPLVEERGSKNQATAGLGLTYKFGL